MTISQFENVWWSCFGENKASRAGVQRGYMAPGARSKFGAPMF